MTNKILEIEMRSEGSDTIEYGMIDGMKEEVLYWVYAQEKDTHGYTLINFIEDPRGYGDDDQRIEVGKANTKEEAHKKLQGLVKVALDKELNKMFKDLK